MGIVGGLEIFVNDAGDHLGPVIEMLGEHGVGVNGSSCESEANEGGDGEEEADSGHVNDR